ncbi:MAG: hypothetical protein AAB809_00050 [Patescibacteria group bacterium]
MEPNFQTSFIPKKSIITERVPATRPVSFFVIISIFILFCVILATGVLYFYKGIKIKGIAEMEKNLNLAKNRFEPAKITELQVLGKRLNASTEILSKHIAITPIFEELQKITMKTVRYTQFNYDFTKDEPPMILVRMSGVAVGYRSVALQADLFNNKNFIDPIFSNLQLDDKGNVLFNLEFAVDPSFVDYKKTILVEEVGEENESPIPVIPNDIEI